MGKEKRTSSISIGKKSLTAIILASISLFTLLLGGCESKEQKAYKTAQEDMKIGNYSEALVTLTDISGYEDSNEKIKECNYNIALSLLGLAESAGIKPVASSVPGVATNDGYFVADNIDNLNKAMKYLQEAADYKDSSTILDKVQKSVDYKNAEALFKSGKLSEAKALFEKLGSDFASCNKYILGIDALSKVVGEWKGYNDDDYYNMVDITCTIGAPFNLGSSKYKDCDWAITASIDMEVSAIRLGSIADFRIADNAGFDFMTDEQALSDFITVDNDNTNDLIFNSKVGVYSKVLLTYDEKSDTISLQEIPYDLNWTTAYTQGGGSMTLDRKK